ncbi:cell division topological specificity factor MinE [Radicibacter daui]|uniref:cell division topological specificity factor MinE n=1 Tax=Radicibacter daui TaxID=3064829 RepID=UPI004046D970
MSIFDVLFRKKEPQSASIAKERLQIVLAHERSRGGGPDFLPDLKRDILQVVAKYVEISDEQINVQLESSAATSMLEINIEFQQKG